MDFNSRDSIDLAKTARELAEEKAVARRKITFGQATPTRDVQKQKPTTTQKPIETAAEVTSTSATAISESQAAPNRLDTLLDQLAEREASEREKASFATSAANYAPKAAVPTGSRRPHDGRIMSTRDAPSVARPRKMPEVQAPSRAPKTGEAATTLNQQSHSRHFK